MTESSHLIDTQDQLKEFLPALRKTDWVGLDTEADSLHSYPEKLCLLQISIPGKDVLIDPLSSLDISPLFEALNKTIHFFRYTPCAWHNSCSEGLIDPEIGKRKIIE